MKYAKPFYVFRLEEQDKAFTPQQQTDYYAITLIGDNTPGGGSRLYFYNPHEPQAALLPRQSTGFSCLFHTSLLSIKMHDQMQALPMFRNGANPVYFLNPLQNKRIRGLFEKMVQEVNDHYAFKYELLGNYLAEIIHQVLKIQANTCQ